MNRRSLPALLSLLVLLFGCNESGEGNAGGSDALAETGCVNTDATDAGACTGAAQYCAWQGVRAAGAPDCGTCEGADGTFWALEDLQPQSCGSNAIYGLEAFEGRVVVLSLLRTTCSFCQSQIQKMEEMALDLQLAGVDVQFVVVNQAGQTFEDTIEEFTSRASMPIFQDTEALDIWAQLGGSKDDIYIYGSDGRLITYQAIPSEETNFTLAQDDGYANLRQLIVDAVAADAGRAE